MTVASSNPFGRAGPPRQLWRRTLGYFKDEKKTAETFPTINGVRYSIPGDYATVETDGSITLLGRGSVSINSGGEKICEEVEEALKSHPDVIDCNVVGLPDERWGRRSTPCSASRMAPRSATMTSCPRPNPHRRLQDAKTHSAGRACSRPERQGRLHLGQEDRRGDHRHLLRLTTRAVPAR